MKCCERTGVLNGKGAHMAWRWGCRTRMPLEETGGHVAIHGWKVAHMRSEGLGWGRPGSRQAVQELWGCGRTGGETGSRADPLGVRIALVQW